MPKKLLISTLIVVGALAGAAINISPASAEEVVIDGTKYWTYDEVQAESEKYVEHRKMCKDDFNCENYLDIAYTLTEDVHGAASAFAKYYFMITAIDPNAATIKVLFHNDTSKRWNNNELDVFKNLYLSWWEPGTADYSIAGFTGESGNPNRHEIFTRIAKEGEDWLPANTEIEIPVSREDIAALKTTNIFWAAQSKLSNTLSERDFSSCLTEIERQPGYECRAVFDFMGNILYRKTEIKQAPTPVSTPETNEPKTVATEKISTSVIRVPEIVTEVVHDNLPENAADSTVAATTEAAETPKDTVEVPLAAGRAENHQFPWWLIVFMLSGIFLVLWWLIPAKKVEKNS